MAMTPSLIDGKLSYTYDYETGYPWYAMEDGSWKKGDVGTGAQTQGPGKVTAIENICVKEYGWGPLAGFMDSTGDYNFCTEFSNLKFVICFNRADRMVTDGGSIIAELSMYQKDILGYDLKTANKNGDTLYVLQGRDENKKRTLINSNKTLKLEKDEEQLYRGEENAAVYQYMVDNKLSTADAINTFCIKTDKENLENKLGFNYGFLEQFPGYHSK